MIKMRKMSVLRPFASMKFTLVNLSLAMLLVLIGTLAQVNMGTFAAQKAYFDSWWITMPVGELTLPVFPGGLTIGFLWLINLIAAFLVRFPLQKKSAGILMSHFGVILLLLGQGITQMTARESHMPIEIGHTRQYSESFRDTELAIVTSFDDKQDQVTSIPYKRFSRVGDIPLEHLPFTLRVRRFLPNAELRMTPSLDENIVTRGMGTRISVKPIPVTHSDEEANTVTVFVEILEAGKSHGVWLLSSALGQPETFTMGGKTYQMAVRLERTYYPFTLTLLDFRHDRYIGTDIPKNFSSQVRLSNTQTGEVRDVLIYMNNPLRYEGKTFYQASFGKEDRLSVFQVVDNPVAWAPYFSCALVILGLGIHFLLHLIHFLRRRNPL